MLYHNIEIKNCFSTDTKVTCVIQIRVRHHIGISHENSDPDSSRGSVVGIRTVIRTYTTGRATSPTTAKMVENQIMME